MKRLLSRGVPVVILFSFLILAMGPDLRTQIPALIGVTAIVTILLVFTLYAGEKVPFHWSPGLIIGIAAILRLIFLFRPPELSDDIYRYLWDGLRMLDGHNPYSLAPSQVQTPNETYSHLLKYINHSDMTTIYPPAAQFTFALGALFGHSVLGIKVLLLIIDLATCFTLLEILSHLNIPAWRGTLYAWHPLPVIEIGASGHVDGAAIFFFLITILLLLKQADKIRQPRPEETRQLLVTETVIRPLLAGFFFASAVLVKFIPLVFLPVILIITKGRNRILFLTGAVLGATVLTFPFLPEMKTSFVTLNTYLQNWEFSGFAFRLLRDLAASGYVSRMLLAATFLITITSFYWKLRPKKNSVNFPNVLKTLYFAIMSFLLMTTTLYPWYALYLACLLPFVEAPAGVALSWSVFLSYKVLIPYTILGLWIEDTLTSAMIWAAPVLAFLIAALAKKSGMREGSAV